MRKAAIITLLLLLSMPAFATMSDNISATDGWIITCERVSDQATTGTFHLENRTGTPAFKVKVFVKCYDFHNKELENIKIIEDDGPVIDYLKKDADIPYGTERMIATVFWKTSLD